MKTIELNKKEAIDRIAGELESGSDSRYLVGYTETAEQGRILYVEPTGQVFPCEYVGERTFRLIDLMPEPFFWEIPYSPDDEEYMENWENWENAESAAKIEIEAELLDEYKFDSLIDPDGEDVKIIWV